MLAREYSAGVVRPDAAIVQYVESAVGLTRQPTACMREEEVTVSDIEKLVRQRKRAGSGYSRSRWNSMKHGLAANTVVVPGEDTEAFDRLLAEYIEEWKPGGPTQTRLVRELAVIDWKLTRYARPNRPIIGRR